MIHANIKQRMDELKAKFGDFAGIEDYRLFTSMCIRDFFFIDSGEYFNPDDVLDWITDGANDGGIDAVFTDPNSEDNDVVIVQSKLYSSGIKKADVKAEILKIKDTLENLQNGFTEGLSDKVVSQFAMAKSLIGQNGVIKVFFFASCAKPKISKGEISKILKSFPGTEVEIFFEEDILARIEQCESSATTVNFGELRIDAENNMLRYEDSIIVNVSATSLKTLFQLRWNSLFGLNLRYYINKKEVDDAIRESIKVNNQDFWYKNNGLVIICNDYEIQGTKLILKDFSIINGGQTTNRIGHFDFEKDFFLQCKVIKSKTEENISKEEFAASIAVASNSQKPVKRSDLVANSPEQFSLKKRLREEGVTYLLKTGQKEKPTDKPYEVTKMDKVGKIGLAAILQMPGTARSQSTKMYQEDLYGRIFGEKVPAGILADGLKLQYYYMEFLKKHRYDPNYDDTQRDILRCGFTFQLAIISFFGKLKNTAFTYPSVISLKTNTEELRGILAQNGKMKHILVEDIEKEENIGRLETIFTGINNICLYNAYNNAKLVASYSNINLTVSDYLKSDICYYRDILNHAWNFYNNYHANNDFDSILRKK